MAIEVTHVGSERVVFAVETFGRCPAEWAPGIGGSVNLHRWIDAEEIVQTADVIVVPVGYHYEIQLAEIHAQRFDIVLKNLGIPACVEKDPLTAKFDQRGESPGFGNLRGLPECVVENRDAIGSLTLTKGWKQKKGQQEITKKSKSHEVLLQKARLEGATIVGDCSPMQCVLPRSCSDA